MTEQETPHLDELEEILDSLSQFSEKYNIPCIASVEVMPGAFVSLTNGESESVLRCVHSIHMNIRDRDERVLEESVGAEVN